MRVAVVTGASRGIGRAIAVDLASEGFAVAINYASNSQAAEETASLVEKAGGRAITISADVSDSASVDAMLDSVVEKWGRLDVLVNNAGIAVQVPGILEISDELFLRTLQVNLLGAFYSIRSAIPKMKAAGGGRIVNISSIAAKTGGMVGAHYAASKAGLLALTIKTARELASQGITVNAVLPGLIDTEMAEPLIDAAGDSIKQIVPLGRVGSPGEVASLVRYLCVEAPLYLTGECITMAGGMTH